MRKFHSSFIGMLIILAIVAVACIATPATAKDRVTCGRGGCHEGIRPW